MYSMYYDTTMVNSNTCNFFNSAFTSLSVLYVSPFIASVLINPGGDILVIPLIAMYMTQIGYDLWIYYNILSLGLTNHYYSDP